MPKLEKKVAIVGIGETPFGKLPGRHVFELMAEVVGKAIVDAGLKKEEIDGFFSLQCMAYKHPRISTASADYLQLLPLKVVDSVNLGAASVGTMMARAASAIMCGMAETVICAAVDLQLTGLSRDRAIEVMAELRHPEYEQPYGLFAPAFAALKSRRWLEKNHIDPDKLAHVAVTMRQYASTNPNAMYQQPLTVEDVLNSRMIAEPLHLLDCAPVCDGGAAVILTTAEKAEQLQKPPVYWLGVGEYCSHDYFISDPCDGYLACKYSTDIVYDRTGLRPNNIDLVMIHDGFSPLIPMTLEASGFCKEGEGVDFVADGNIGPGGKLPVNTHGGLLSHGHPGYPGGMAHVTEAVRQLRGEAGPRQVPNVGVAMIQNGGGPLATFITTLLGGADV